MEQAAKAYQAAVSGPRQSPPNSAEPNRSGEWHIIAAREAAKAGIPNVTSYGLRAMKEIIGAPQIVAKIESGEINNVATSPPSAYSASRPWNRPKKQWGKPQFEAIKTVARLPRIRGSREGANMPANGPVLRQSPPNSGETKIIQTCRRMGQQSRPRGGQSQTMSAAATVDITEALAALADDDHVVGRAGKAIGPRSHQYRAIGAPPPADGNASKLR
jgi:hypothetical protein